MSRFLIITILLSYILSLGLGLVGPEVRRLKELRKRIARKEELVSHRKEYLSSLKKSEREIETHREDIEKMRKGLPRRPETSYLFELVQDAVYKEGMLLKGLKGMSTSLKQKKERGDLKETRLVLEVKGSYQGLLALMERFEKSARLIETDQVSFSVPEEEEKTESSLFGFELTIRTHSLSPSSGTKK